MTWWHYLLLVNFYLVLFFGFYALLLRRETFFQLNRIYLVAAALLSFIIPVIEADWVKNLFITQEVQQTIYNIPVGIPIIFAAPVETGITLGQVLNAVYISVTLFMLIRLMWQLIVLKKAIEKPTPSAAYTFFKKISLGENVVNSKVINDHEQVHAKQWHSIDVMIIETVMIINWFNPVVYLYRFAIKYIHEFIADSHVINAGADKADYAMLLLTQSFDVQSHNLVNQFYNHSLLKKRIMMLQKNKSQRIALAKYGLSVPLFMLMMVFSSATINDSKAVAVITNKTEAALEIPATDLVGAITDNAQIPAENLTEETKAIVELPFGIYDVEPVELPADMASDTNKVDQQPSFPGGMESFGKYLSMNIKYPAADRNAGIQGRVIISFFVEPDGTLSEIKSLREPSQSLADEAIRVIRQSPKWKPGSKDGKPVRVAFVTPVSFTIRAENGGEIASESKAVAARSVSVNSSDNKPVAAPSNALQTNSVVIRGYVKRDGGSDNDNMIFSQVENPPNFPGGLAAFGKFLGENIRFPKADRDNKVQGRVIAEFIVEKDGSLNNIKAIRGPSQAMMDEAVLVLSKSPKWQPGYQNGNAVRVSYTVPIAFTLDADNKKSSTATEVQINPGTTVSVTGSGVRIGGGSPTSPLYVIDGEVLDAEAAAKYGFDQVASGISPLSLIKQADIASMEILKDATAIERYGNRGKNGVILIVTKDKKGLASLTANQGNKASVTVRSTKPSGNVIGITVSPTTVNGKAVSPSKASVQILQRSLSGKITPTSPLYVIDGKVVKPNPKAKGVSPLSEIKQENIAGIEVLTDSTAKTLYGDAGKYGVIIITTKKAKK
jgi:TonB family protein